MRLGLGIGLGFKVNAILQAFAQKYDPLVIFGSDLVTYYGNSVDELFADHRKAWEDSPNLADGVALVTPEGGQLTVTGDTVRITATAASAWQRVELRVPITWGKAYFVRLRVTGIASGAQSFVSANNGGGTDLPGLPGYRTSPETATAVVYPTRSGTQHIHLQVFVRRNAGAASIGDWVEFSRSSVRVQEVDLTKLRLYQDSAGNTPVTAVEQFVGLVLDRSQGLVFGPNLFNGTFSTVTAPWVANGDGSWSINGSQSGEVDLSSNGAVGAANNVMCEWRITISGLASGSLIVYPGSLSPVSLANGTHRILQPRSSTLFIVRASAGQTATVSGISVRELPGNHLSQSTAAARPRLTRRVNLLSATEDLTAAVWTKTAATAGADLLTESTAAGSHSVWQGASKPSVAIAYQFSFDAKAAGRTQIRCLFYGNDYTSFAECRLDLQTGAISNIVSAGGAFALTAQDITVFDVGDGWWRLTARPGASNAQTSVKLEIRTLSAGSDSYTGDGVSGVRVRKADIRPASLATPAFPPYQRVTSDTDYDEVWFPARLRLDGVDDFLTSSQLPLAGVSALSALGTYSRVSSGRNDALWSTNPLASGFAAIVSSSDGDQLRVDLLDSTKKQVVAIPGGTNFVATALLDTTQAAPSDEIIGRANGVAGSIATTGAGVSATMSNAPLEVGRWAGSAYLLGDIFALPMIVKRLMTPGELAEAERAFGKSIGVLQ